MASRLSLHEDLKSILGSNNVYYQPPASVRMAYPCIKYSLSGVDQTRANNATYNLTNRYEVIVIDTDPDNLIHEKVLSTFPMCRLDQVYVADNLYHKVITLYY